MSLVARRVYGEPGTLYSRCGGVFGISAFVDRCMDRWMADDTLNANRLVARWHEQAQRPGFKFLVVQIVCNLTGGPQRYTGRPMDACHKHLNISEAEWRAFMAIFGDVCGECGLAADMLCDLACGKDSLSCNSSCFNSMQTPGPHVQRPRAGSRPVKARPRGSGRRYTTGRDSTSTSNRHHRGHAATPRPRPSSTP